MSLSLSLITNFFVFPCSSLLLGFCSLFRCWILIMLGCLQKVLDLQGMIDLINVNIGSVNWVTKVVQPGMLKRKKGAIVYIDSGSSVVVPYKLDETFHLLTLSSVLGGNSFCNMSNIFN
ncbi:unnamed protein product [Amaranthus hypochondriacus]